MLMDKYVSFFNPRQNMRGFLVGIIILAGLGMAVGASLVSNRPVREAPIEEISTERFSSPNVFVYAFWAGDKSEVKSFDLSNGQDASLATLPLNVKHIKLLSSNEILYINDTDEKDYGTQIVAKTIPNGQERIVVQANSDVKIDDYRVSPNGQYVATWEVALPPDSEQLFNGVSRVYVTDITTGVKNQIYSEQANAPVHYPVAVTNDGRVFMDTFLPNDNAGWAYGMSVSDFSGANKQDLPITNGTYGSQPVLSPDGSMLVFTGYDGSKGAGTDLVRDTRRAILSANTVDVLDLNSLSRRRLTNLSTNNYYPKAWWDDVTGNVLISMVSKSAGETGTYSYSLTTNTAEKIDLAKLDPLSPEPKKPISILGSGIYLAGNVTTSESTLGNLGGHYEQVMDSVYVVNVTDNDVISLDVTDGFIQTIAVKPTSYFGQATVSAFSQSSTDSSGGIKGKSQEQLQLQTFTIKPTLAPVRNEQQSGERCRDVVANSCNELLGTNYTADQAAAARSGSFEDQAFGQCAKEQWSVAQSAGCANSPLYLYGDKGEEFNVKVGTTISNSNAPYTPSTGYTGTLNGDGGVTINGLSFDSLDFDYNLAGKYVAPDKGVIIYRYEFDAKLADYAKKLGMNEKETYDFIKYIKSETSSGKIFLSHFSNSISQKLLPLYITPQPESYTNIVFYVNDSGIISNNNPSQPNYEKIARDGFTAVEISYILAK